MRGCFVCAGEVPVGFLPNLAPALRMWAGYLALVNQQLVSDLDHTLAFINPNLYTFGLGPGYDTDFHDIKSGSNGYPATKGYDLATGWGSPDGTGLINAVGKAVSCWQAADDSNGVCCANRTGDAPKRRKPGRSDSEDPAVAESRRGEEVDFPEPCWDTNGPQQRT